VLDHHDSGELRELPEEDLRQLADELRAS